MKDLIFCTGNAEKFANAQLVCQQHSIALSQQQIDIDEIQSEDGEVIVRDKLQKAYQQVSQPLVVTDDTWLIPGLRGFPGPYMKSINHWFTPDDLLRLTLPLEDRNIFLVQWLGYTDGEITKVFTSRVPATLLKEVRGVYGSASHKLISLKSDNGLSIAEIYDKGLDRADRDAAVVWHNFLEWHQNT
jgi:XTP/dITP diphosphohydrolase